MKLQRCWLHSLIPITECLYTYEDSLIHRLSATPSRLGIKVVAYCWSLAFAASTFAKSSPSSSTACLISAGFCITCASTICILS
ncbi:Uncharacterised protein [Vibrio cholerae]|nr:Uncharacterised protein [Vibrio cholerae]